MKVRVKRKLNVLVSSSIFPNNMETNKGIYILHTVKALSKYCNIKVIAPVPYFPWWLKIDKYNYFSKIKKIEYIDGIEVLHPRAIVLPNLGRFLYGLFYTLSILYSMRAVKRVFKTDIIICYWLYPDGLANVLVSKLLKTPIIVGGRGCDINSLNDFFGKKLMVTWVMRSSTRVFSVSSAMKEIMMGLGVSEDKIAVIPNGLNDIFTNCVRNNKNVKKNVVDMAKKRKTILYCGRFSYEKGIKYLIKAAKILSDQKTPFRLLLVGDGKDKEYIINLVDELDLIDCVDFMSEVPHHEIPKLMNSSDILCLPSIREGYPNVILEAMACGLPVVATEVGGVPEIINKTDYGILVPRRNSRLLAEALDSALKRSWNRSRIQAAVKDRTWDDVALKILGEIKEVLG